MLCKLSLAVLIMAHLLRESLCVCSCVETYGYKALAGEDFIMQCAPPNQSYLFNISKSFEERMTWFRTEGDTKRILPGGDNAIVKQGNYIQFMAIEDRHAGNYSCCYGGLVETCFLLNVISRNGTDCKDHGESEVTLTVGQGGPIPCPGVHCYGTSSQKAIRWYKENKSTSKLQSRYLEFKDNTLLLKTVYPGDDAVFTCDVSHVDGIVWTVRRRISVKVIAQERQVLPRILYPYENCTEEAELEKPKILTCRVQFAYQKDRSTVIRWFVTYNDDHREPLETDRRIMKENFGEEIINGSAHLPQVNLKHLQAVFTCFAQNSVGNASATMRLNKKFTVQLLLVMTGPVVTLVFVTGVSVLVRVYWMEILIICQMYTPFADSIADGKEYDAFVSYASCFSSEEDSDDVTGDMLALHHMPRVLEQEWGYKLCLLERDPIPGEAYTKEVVRCIQKSRMLICLLSPGYLRGNCLFELEMGLKSLQEDRQLRVLLIWGSTPPRRLRSLPLPNAVSRALRILPAIHCTPTDLTHSSSRFWKDLSLKMPRTKVCVSNPREIGHS